MITTTGAKNMRTNKQKTKKKKKTKSQVSADRRRAALASAETKRLKKQNGLVSPCKIKLGSAEFLKIQKEWYGKLEKDGFEDLEFTDLKTGNTKSDYLKVALPKSTKDRAESLELYYALFRNFLTHVTIHDGIDDCIVRYHSQGLGYQDIVKKLNSKYKKKFSVSIVPQRLRRIKKLVMNWNNTSQHGLFVTRAENNAIMDKFFEERFNGRGESTGLPEKINIDNDDEV
jgi:hypothetical protein